VGVTGNDVTNRSRPWDRVLQLIPVNMKAPVVLMPRCCA